jgi:molybdopterin converting factor small subunit
VSTITADDYDVYYVVASDDETFDYTNGKEIDFGSINAVDFKDVANYVVIFKTKDGITNYKFDLTSDVLANITKQKVFLDVPNDAWYTQYVYDANMAGYVNGYNDGFFFGPDDAIKRGDVVVILARMAGFENVTADDSTNQLYGYTSKFADVDNNTYYAHAIAWAANVGIVTGTSDTTFEPDRNVTREEFVTMLQRYANLKDDGKAVATDAAAELTKYTDGTAVCDWAKDAVAWASENEIMTGYAGTTVLDPEGTVTRAQVAKMAVKYQPKSLKGSILGNTDTDKTNQVNVNTTK